MKNRINPFLRSASLAASIVLTLGQAASAAPYYWNTTTTSTWATGANWSLDPTGSPAGTAAPSSTDTAVFNGSGVNGAEIVQLDAPASIAGITFANTGTTLINASAAGSQALTIGTGGITINSGAGAVTIGDASNLVPITLGGSQTWTNSSSNALNIVNAVTGSTNLLTLTGNNTASNPNGNTFNLQGGLTGSGGVKLTGNTTNAVTLNISGAVSGNNVLGTGPITTVTSNCNFALNFNQTGGTATVGSLALTNPNIFTIGGTGAVGFGAFTQTSGGVPTLTVNNSGGVSFTTFALNTGSGGGLIINGSGNTTISGAVSGTSKALTYSGSGKLTLASTNSYSGTTTVSGGTLVLGHATDTLSDSGAISITSGKLDFDANSDTVGIITMTGGQIGGTSGTLNSTRLNVYGTAEMTGGNINAGVSNRGLAIGSTAAGAFTLSNGILTSTGGASFDILANNYNGTFTINGGEYVNTGTLQTNIGTGGTASTATFTIASGKATIGTLALNTANGTANSNAANRISIVNLNGGILQLSTLTVSNTAPGGSATFNFNGGQFIAGAALPTFSNVTLNVKDNGAKIDTNGFSFAIGALVNGGTGVGGLTKSGAGTLTLSGTNSYTGDTTVSEGTLSLGDATNNTALENTAKVFIASGAILNLNYLVGNTDTVKELWIGGVQKPAGVYSVSDPSGQITGSGTLTVTTSPAPADPFASWIGGPPYNLSGPSAAFDFDYDNDGIKNGLEWILGGNPTQNDTPSILPVTTGSAVSGLTLVFNRATASLPPASTLVVDFDGDLDATWAKSVTIGAANSGPDANGVTVAVDTPSAGKVTVTIPASNAVSGKLFSRLRAVKP